MYITCVYYSNKILETREIKENGLLLHRVSGCLHTVHH